MSRSARNHDLDHHDLGGHWIWRAVIGFSLSWGTPMPLVFAQSRAVPLLFAPLTTDSAAQTAGAKAPTPKTSAPTTSTPNASASHSPGYRLLDKGWVDDAIAAFEASLQRNPNNVSERLGLAIAYQASGDDARAWQAYQAVLAQDPTNFKALTSVGILGGYRSEWQAAGIAALTTLLAAPQDPVERLSALAQRALLLGYQERFTEAIADYQQVLQDPSFVAQPEGAVLVSAAQVYAYTGDYERSLTLFDQARTLGAALSDDAIAAAGLALRETGRTDQAVALLRPRVEALPSLSSRSSMSSLELRTGLALVYTAQGRWEPAKAILVSLRPFPQAQLPLARALRVLGQRSGDRDITQEAIARYRELYRQALQGTAQPAPGLLREVAEVLRANPETQAEALEVYDRLIAAAPAARDVQVQRLLLAYQLGQMGREQLTQQLQTQLQSLPAEPAARQRIAQALVPLDAPSASLLPSYQALLDSPVQEPFLNYRIAQMQLERQNFPGARQALERYRQTADAAKSPQDPARSTSELMLADIERREGNFTASGDRYAALIKAAGNDPQTEAIALAALRGLAGVKFGQRDYGAATRLYRQVLTLKPGDRETQQALAELHLAQDQPLAALQQLQSLQAQQPGPAIAERVVEVKVDRLKRRGFQPEWERY